jgi:hypothetical protein
LIKTALGNKGVRALKRKLSTMPIFEIAIGIKSLYSISKR